MTQWRSFTLPAPISTNALTRNVAGKGRVKTQAYKDWIALASLELRRQLRPMPRCPGPFHLDILVSGPGDIDNVVKCIPDLLKREGVIVDDKPQYMVDLHVRYCLDGPCYVAIRPIGEWA
jgi:Holliday junction resolvase RusA-like endonuclease